MPAGHVVLVGAGPGNSGLMTLQGLRALQEADVIVHDRLVSAEVMDLARRDAARFDVGKFVGGGGATQEEINKLLVEHAQRGEYVVRLKGGDPFVFGRGGEEIDFLRANGVSYEVDSRHHRRAGRRRLCRRAAHRSALFAGRALPHRQQRRAACAVQLLGSRRRARNARVLHERRPARRRCATNYWRRACSGDMPVAFIENASRAEQRVLVSTVEGMHRDAVMQKIKAPTMLIIGNVAQTAAELQWFGRAAAGASA